VAFLVVLAVAGCGADRRASALSRADVSPAQARALGLTRTLPRAYARVCRAQAAYAPPGARACPPLIPEASLEVMTSGPFSRQARYRGGFTANLASRALNRLGGTDIDTNGGHWGYVVTWTRAVRRLVVGAGIEHPSAAAAPSRCRRVVVARRPVRACRVVAYERGGGLHGGHVVYIWDRGRVTYVVSLHGYANEPRARAMMHALIAQRLGFSTG
jgi:hypothetical protein